MGKTIRRKGVNSNGAYDWMDDTRQRHGAGKNYYHSDMPGRNGLAHGVDKNCKEEASQHRRTETKRLVRIVAANVDEFYPKDDKHARSKSNEHWHWS